MKLAATLATMLCLAAGTASATTFTNGGFETGDFSGWTLGGGFRGSTLNNSLTTAMLLPSGSLFNSSIATGHSVVINSSYVDPNLGSLLGSTVYSGNYSARIEDTFNGGYASVVSQTVANYTDSNIFFAWKAVLENGGHTADESAEMLIELTDNTTGNVVIRRQFNAGASGVGVDNRFSSSGDLYYTPSWQVEQLALTPAQMGDTFTLSVLGADCELTGHTGYIFLDGFGAVSPPVVVGVPEPASLALLGTLALAGITIRRKKQA